MTEQPTDEILIQTANSGATRGDSAPRGIKVELLTQNMNIFIGQINAIIGNSPDEVGKFKLTEFTVTAEISAKGTIAIVGTGVETEGRGSFTLKFEKK